MKHLTRRRAAKLLGAIRLLNGLGSFFAPKPMATMMGVDPDEHPPMIYVLRLFGIRTILLGLHLLRANDEDEIERAMRIGVVIHLSDTVAAALAGVSHQVPRRSSLTATAISSVNTALAVRGSLAR